VRAAGGHHLDGATSKTERRREHRLLSCPLHDVLERARDDVVVEPLEPAIERDGHAGYLPAWWNHGMSSGAVAAPFESDPLHRGGGGPLGRNDRWVRPTTQALHRPPVEGTVRDEVQ